MKEHTRLIAAINELSPATHQILMDDSGRDPLKYLTDYLNVATVGASFTFKILPCVIFAEDFRKTQGIGVKSNKRRHVFDVILYNLKENVMSWATLAQMNDILTIMDMMRFIGIGENRVAEQYIYHRYKKHHFEHIVSLCSKLVNRLYEDKDHPTYAALINKFQTTFKFFFECVQNGINPGLTKGFHSVSLCRSFLGKMEWLRNQVEINC
jgi:hypothetical protein